MKCQSFSLVIVEGGKIQSICIRPGFPDRIKTFIDPDKGDVIPIAKEHKEGAVRIYPACRYQAIHRECHETIQYVFPGLGRTYIKAGTVVIPVFGKQENTVIHTFSCLAVKGRTCERFIILRFLSVPVPDQSRFNSSISGFRDV